MFSLRKNTGYQDGSYGLVSGHLEENETPSEAMIREAKEEIGIDLDPSHLKMVHIMHRRTDRENIDFFFLGSNWSKPIQNLEPNKCEELVFFSPSEIPKNAIPYITDAIENIMNGISYKEYE